MTTAANKGTLAQALLAFQADAPALQKDKINPAFKSRYLSLDGLMEQVLPILNKHGLVITQSPTVTAEGLPALRTKLIHAASDESLEDVMLLMLAKQDPQGQGSAITYARRYSLMAVCGLVADEDDDGNKASRPPATQTTTEAQPNGAGASEAQLRKLSVQAKELKEAGSLTDEQLQAAIENLGASSIETLSKAQASNLIERLEKYREHIGAGA